MYKKITHTIVEEHFDHPLAAEIKNTLDDEYGELRPMIGVTTAEKFRADINDYFAKLHLRLTNIANATEAGNMDTLITEETAFFDEVVGIGKMLQPYYGIEFSERFSQAFRGLGLSMIGIGRNLKYKNDTKLIVDRLDLNFDQLDLLLNQFNNSWLIGTAKRMWLAIRDSIVTEATAIMNKDNTGSATAHAQAADRLSTFATSFANSVIQQYPNKFIA